MTTETTTEDVTQDYEVVDTTHYAYYDESDEGYNAEYTDYEYENWEEYTAAQAYPFDDWVQMTEDEYYAKAMTYFANEGITIESMIAQMEADMWDAAEDEWGFMPLVCPPGKECRAQVWEELNAAVYDEWVLTFESAKRELAAQMKNSVYIIEETWYNLIDCPHGCREGVCTDQAVLYTNTYNRIIELETKIQELLWWHETEVNTYEEVLSECPNDVEKIEIEHYTTEVY